MCGECFRVWYQCDQIGRFLKVPGDKFSYKISPNVWQVLGYLKKHYFSSKNECKLLLANFG